MQKCSPTKKHGVKKLPYQTKGIEKKTRTCLYIEFGLLKCQTVTPKTSSDNCFLRLTGAYDACNTKMTLSLMQIHQTVKNDSVSG